MNPLPPRRSIKDYLLPFLIIVAIGVCAALAVRLWSLMNTTEDDSGFSMSGKAALTTLKGEVEAYLPANQAWKIITDENTLNSEEGVRTAADGMAKIAFDDGSVVTLGNSSEIKIDNLENSLGKKTVAITIVRGAAWIASTTTAGSDFSIGNDLIKLTDPTGEILLIAGETETSASAIGGEITATILDPKNTDKPELKTYVVNNGETIAISERRINLLRIGGDIELVKKTTTEVTTSPLYLAMHGETAAAVTETTTTEDGKTTATTVTGDTLPADVSEKNPATTTDTTTTATTVVGSKLATPVVITNGGKIKALTSPVVVSGSVGVDIVKVEVAYGSNPAFALSKFVAGSGSWKYNASATIGNMKEGVNSYTVVGYDKDGNKTPTGKFTIEYTPTATTTDTTTTTPATPSVSSEGVPSIGSTTFAAPTVSQPKDGATITSAPIIFYGSVSANTKQVSVNGYVLSKYTAGATSWSYKADPQYGNLKEGENEYEIEAISDTGDKSSVTIKITYKPATVTPAAE